MWLLNKLNELTQKKTKFIIIIQISFLSHAVSRTIEAVLPQLVLRPLRPLKDNLATPRLGTAALPSSGRIGFAFGAL